MHQQFSSEEPHPLVQQTECSYMVQARIDAYLDRTCAPLFLSLPQEEATQQRAEMQSHLESLVAAHIELGFTELEAVSLALEQFGKEQSVAQAWKQECEETNVERGNGTILSVLRPLVGYSLLNWTVWMLLIEAVAHFYNRTARSGASPADLLVWAALMIGEFALFPTFLGFLVGQRTRGHTQMVALLALPCTITLCGTLVLKIHDGCHLFQPVREVNSNAPALYALLPLGMYLGFGAMGVGAALLRRRRTRRLAGNR